MFVKIALKTRSIAASLLAVLLFCGTSWASVCDLTCQLGRMQPICSVAAMEHTAMAIACDHCPGVMVVGNSAYVTSACSSMDCGQMVVTAARASEIASAPMPDASGDVVEAVKVPVKVHVQDTSRLVRPPLSGSEFHPLSVSLRV